MMSRVVLVLIVGALGGGLGSCGDYPPYLAPSAPPLAGDDGAPLAGDDGAPLAGDDGAPLAGDDGAPSSHYEVIEWVTIPAGDFEMGSNEGNSDERPIHTVTLRSFQMSKTEVTGAQYNACVEAGVCTAPSCGGQGDDHPVVCVDWGQARTFAKWIGADVDLPTEAEWEYAARGGESFNYAGSDSADDVAWYSSNSGGGTKPVGTKRANGYGLHDMSGNVWEWVLDEYKGDYSNAPSDGHQAAGSIPTCNTRCDTGAAGRVLRGGGWRSDAGFLRVAGRRGVSPDDRYGFLGLRLRRTLP